MGAKRTGGKYRLYSKYLTSKANLGARESGGLRWSAGPHTMYEDRSISKTQDIMTPEQHCDVTLQEEKRLLCVLLLL